jgi:acetyl-CoA synthetase
MLSGSERWPIIHKSVPALRVRPNLVDYEATCRSFSWEAERGSLSGATGEGGINIASVAVDRHAAGPLAAKDALRFVHLDGTVDPLTYADLAERTDRFASVLRDLGVGRGERVFSLLGRCPELYVAALGTLKNASVFSPLFSAFGPEPVRQRMNLGSARVLVTTRALYARKVVPIRHDLATLEHVLLVDGGDDSQRPEGTLDLHPEDVYWCTADPGWVTGMSYGVIAPLVHGVTAIVDEDEFDADRWYRILEEQRVSVWYTAPTALRMLKKAGSERAAAHDLSALRFIASVGEPLNPEVVAWGVETYGKPIHDNWWQTETGGIMIANFAAMDVRPGSMGRPLPGVVAAIVRRDDRGDPVMTGDDAVLESEPDVVGELALRPGWPSMFRGYLGEEERYRSCFAGGWYLTGDLATRDADGYFWFVGRGDDVIKSSGHLIGPFEVESTLMEHPAVAEAGVIGVPDAVAGEVVKAFVELRPGWEPSDDLRREIIGFGRKRLGAAVAPRELDFTDAMPRTRSGKILRRLLKARELGLPEGDTSTVEAPR